MTGEIPNGNRADDFPRFGNARKEREQEGEREREGRKRISPLVIEKSREMSPGRLSARTSVCAPMAIDSVVDLTETSSNWIRERNISCHLIAIQFDRRE